MEGSEIKTIQDLMEKAAELEDSMTVREFIEENHSQLPDNQKITEGDLQNLINLVEKQVEENSDTYEKYEKMLKKQVDCNTTKKLTALKEFVKENMLHKEVDFIETFLIEYASEFISLTQSDIHIVTKGYKAEKKALKNKQKSIITKNNADPELIIDPEFAGLYSTTLNATTGKEYAVPHVDEIAQRVIENKHVVMYNGNIFCYDDGYYKNNPYPVKAEIVRIFNGICKGSRSNGIKTHLEDVLTVIKNTNPVCEYPFNKHNNAIPVKNGVIVIDFETGEITLQKADPEVWKFNYILSVKYVADEKSDSILNELKKYSPENYQMLVQAAAQALLQAMGYGPYKKAYLLKGKKDCGKTTFLDIVECIIGANNKSKVALSELTPQYRFTRAEMEGKLMNLDDDLGYFKMSETGIFKKLTGGYSQKIERKGLDSYDVRITSVHMFTTNTPAGFDRRIYIDEAFWERWNYIEFNNTFERDDDFKQRILTEANISGFFNEILKMIIEIRKKKQLPYVQKWAEVREKWTQESNVLYKFIEANMVSGGRTAIMKEDLLHAIKAFGLVETIDSNLIPESLEELGNLVEVCGGTRDGRKNFYDKEGKELNLQHCFILNYVWKLDSDFKKYARKERKVSEEEIEKHINNKQLEEFQCKKVAVPYSGNVVVTNVEEAKIALGFKR